MPLSRLSAAHGQGLNVILCVGETEAQRDAGDAERVVADQLLASLPENAAAEWLSIAYEPVWAIGTGRTPTLDEVAAMHAALRDALRSRIGGAADAMRILYCGSMKGARSGQRPVGKACVSTCISRGWQYPLKKKKTKKT